MNGALLAAMDKISAVPGARVLNAVLGLVLAPLILVGVIGFSLYRWWRSGKDPVYLDDPSILMPAPPPGLTPAAGAAVRDGKVTRRALTAASLDLAARGRIAFQAVPSEALFGGDPDLGIFTSDSRPEDPVEQARLERVRRRPMDDATEFLHGRLKDLGGGDGYIEPDDILKLGTDVGDFNSRLEKHLVTQGWFREAPSTVTGRWSCGGILVLVGGIASVVLGANLPSSGILLVGLALIVAAVCLFIVAAAMPARTKDGAVIVAMLEAYRRTLEKTMAMSRSMGQVVEASAIPLIEDPDDAVVWGVALGLQDEVEGVLGAVRRGPVDRPVHDALPAAVVLGRRLGRPGGLRFRGLGARDDELLADPQLRRDDGRPGHDRELAGLVRFRRGRRVLGWRFRRGRRGRGRRLLGGGRGTLGPMGATDTMEIFFEHLNEGDVDAAVALMDERVEMRIHVGDNSRMLRGVEQVGGWFLRADKGLKMVPGDVRDMGNTYQADLVVIRPGAPSQHLDAQFRVEAGKVTSINLTPFSR